MNIRFAAKYIEQGFKVKRKDTNVYLYINNHNQFAMKYEDDSQSYIVELTLQDLLAEDWEIKK